MPDGFKGVIHEIFANGDIRIYSHGRERSYLFTKPQMKLTGEQPQFDLILLENLAPDHRSVLAEDVAQKIAGTIIEKAKNSVDVELRYGTFRNFKAIYRSERTYDPVLERNIDRQIHTGNEEQYEPVRIKITADTVEQFILSNLAGKKISQISAVVRRPHAQAKSCGKELAD